MLSRVPASAQDWIKSQSLSNESVHYMRTLVWHKNTSIILMVSNIVTESANNCHNKPRIVSICLWVVGECCHQLRFLRGAYSNKKPSYKLGLVICQQSFWYTILYGRVINKNLSDVCSCCCPSRYRPREFWVAISHYRYASIASFRFRLQRGPKNIGRDKL